MPGATAEEAGEAPARPPVSSMDELEPTAADCPECGGAKFVPWGNCGQVIACTACDGTGERAA